MKLSSLIVASMSTAMACEQHSYVVTMSEHDGSSARRLTEVADVLTVKDFARGSVVTIRACESEAMKLAAHDDVESVELDFKGAVHVPDGEVRVEDTNERRRALRGGGVSSWGLDRVDQAGLPLDNSYDPDYTGEGVCIYVLDTGIRETHNEFQGRVKAGTNIAYPGRGFENDKDGHGTHCASTAAGDQYGVANQAIIIPVKVLDDNGSGSWADCMEGVEWVEQDTIQCPYNHKIISMSIVGGKNKGMNKVVQNADDIVVVVAAGNGGGDDACKGSPSGASGDHVITVGSTTESDAVSGFSTEGKCVDILAPGSDIKAAGRKSNSATDTMSGTSMATPHVAGIVAQIWEQNPDMSASEVTNRLLDIAVPYVGTGAQRDDTPTLLANTPRRGEITPRQRSIETLKRSSKMVFDGKEMSFSTATFGESIIVGGEIEHVGLGCSTIGDDLDGMVCLVDRGDCDFVKKARMCQDAGAVSMIVANNAKKGTISMYAPSGDKANDINIASIMVSKKDGKKLKRGGVELGLEEPNVCGQHKKQADCEGDNLFAFTDATCAWESKKCTTEVQNRI